MPEENDDQIFRLTETQRAAIQAMAEAGMPASKIADALMIPADLVESNAEWRVGRIEAIRVGQLEAELLESNRKGDYKHLAAKKRAFLAALEANGGNRTTAAAAAGIERTFFYRWLKEDPEFERAFDGAMERAADLLEDEAVRRAKIGILDPIYNRAGQLIGHKLKYSDALLMALLSANRPKKWRSHVSAELTGKDGGPIETKPALPEWLTERFKPNPGSGATTPSPASGDSTETS